MYPLFIPFCEINNTKDLALFNILDIPAYLKNITDMDMKYTHGVIYIRAFVGSITVYLWIRALWYVYTIGQYIYIDMSGIGWLCLCL